MTEFIAMLVTNAGAKLKLFIQQIGFRLQSKSKVIVDYSDDK